MKQNTILGWSAGLAAAAAMLMAIPTSASAAPSDKDKSYKGIIKYVNESEHTITVRGSLKGLFVLRRTFELGKDCSVTLWDNSSGQVGNLHPGQNVIVSYVNVHGVLAADGVKQQPMRYTGIVKFMDPQSRLLVLRKLGHDKRFALAADCGIVLNGQKKGTMASIEPGDHVEIVYEKPGHEDLARQIAQTSVRFTGAIMAVDLGNRTVTAQGAYGARQFTLAKDCSIVMEGRIDAPMMDLQPGQRLTINYDEVNGVDVATRIGPAEAASAPPANAQANR
ncbi:MAG TPA: hypothetical protein VGO59_00500 [Verrucomicrobiae bacterium]|jgi:hypothetical protein